MSAATKKKMLLLPELVPGPLWGRSAHKMLGNRAIWKKQIRGDALTRASNRCSHFANRMKSDSSAMTNGNTTISNQSPL